VSRVLGPTRQVISEAVAGLYELAIVHHLAPDSTSAVYFVAVESVDLSVIVNSLIQIILVTWQSEVCEDFFRASMASEILLLLRDSAKFVAFALLRFVFNAFQAVYWQMNGTAKQVREAHHPENYDRSAQVLDVRLIYSIHFIKLFTMENFICTHNRFESPQYVLDNEDISLMFITDTHAVFCEPVGKGICNLNLLSNYCFYIASYMHVTIRTNGEAGLNESADDAWTTLSGSKLQSPNREYTAKPEKLSHFYMVVYPVPVIRPRSRRSCTGNRLSIISWHLNLPLNVALTLPNP